MHCGNASMCYCPVVESPSMRKARWDNPPRFAPLFVRFAVDAIRHNKKENHAMKWITREHVKVDRVACPWLIKKFVDKDAEFLFVPTDQVMEVAQREGATPYDVKGVELGHHGEDTDNTLWHQPEGEGLEAIAEGFRQLGFKDDHEQNAAEWIVYDALYAYCQEMVRRGKPDGAFKGDPSGSPAGSVNPYDRTGQQAGPKQ